MLRNPALSATLAYSKLSFGYHCPLEGSKYGDRGIASEARDIRSDLEERAHIIQEQMRAAYAHFERMAQQLQSERDARVSGLKETLAMIDKLIQFETGTVAKVVTLENAPASQPSLADRMKAVNAG